MAKRVLVVDDSTFQRRMISESLTDAGWEVVAEAADCQEAVWRYRQFEPDAVALDVDMPGGGLQALDEILFFDPSARVVVFGTQNQTRLISQAIRRGACDFLTKPLLPEQLQEVMFRCLEETAAL
jgi:two-component system, chemotaxis family, chemotaxis protein CheY